MYLCGFKLKIHFITDLIKITITENKILLLRINTYLFKNMKIETATFFFIIIELIISEL